MYIHSSIFVPTLYSILTLSFVFCFLLPPRLSVLNILYLLLMDTHMNPTCDTPCGADRRCLLQTSLVSISSGRARPSVVLCRALLDFTTKKIWAVHFQIVNHFSQTDVKSNNNSHKEELTNMPNWTMWADYTELAQIVRKGVMSDSFWDQGDLWALMRLAWWMCRPQGKLMSYSFTVNVYIPTFTDGIC